MSRSISNNISQIRHTVTNPSVLMEKNVLFLTVLFIMLSPDASKQDKHFYLTIFKHTALLAIILQVMGFSEVDNLKICVLFFVLIPGFIVELPPSTDHVFYTNKNSMRSVLLHSIIFAVLYKSIV